MDTPQTSNSAAKFVGKTVREIFDAAVPVAEASIIAAAPWMAAPVWEQVWEEIFKLGVDELGKALGEAGAFVVMDVQTYFELKDAVTTIKKLREAQASGDSDAIAKAKAEADAAADALLHYDGDAHP
jgi:hypothetical protein